MPRSFAARVTLLPVFSNAFPTNHASTLWSVPGREKLRSARQRPAMRLMMMWAHEWSRALSSASCVFLSRSSALR